MTASWPELNIKWEKGEDGEWENILKSDKITSVTPYIAGNKWDKSPYWHFHVVSTHSNLSYSINRWFIIRLSFSNVIKLKGC